MGEKIPHHEKVFSIFEEHTEWVVKGKAGCPQELGLKVCIVESQHGFILHHQVMQHQTDDQVAVSIIDETKAMYPNLAGCSFDKGFHNKPNQERLKDLLDRVTLPKKGKLSAADKEHEYSQAFQEARRKRQLKEKKRLKRIERYRKTWNENRSQEFLS
jgi:transposase, IS5 family